MTTPRPLTEERDALRQILSRLMSEETSLENLCKLAPRIISVSANVARIQEVIQPAESETMEAIRRALIGLDDDDVDQENIDW